MNTSLPELCYHDGCRRIRGHTGRHEAHPSEAWGHFREKDKDKLNKAGFATPRGGKKGAYQNHVDRSNQVIIPFEFLGRVDLSQYKDGFVIRLFPHQYFASKHTPRPEFERPDNIVKVGNNAFILYRTHASLDELPPLPTWRVRYLTKDGQTCDKRGTGVKDAGEYVLRIPKLGQRPARVEGPPQGMFATEYADEDTNYLCKCVLAWLIIQSADSPYTLAQATHLRSILAHEELGDVSAFERTGVLRNGITQCPLCLRAIKYMELHATVAFDDESGLENAGHQVEGATRSTIINLFHLRPLFYHSLVHLPRNVGWGHAVCNTRLGQRPCYSLEEISEMGRKVGFVREEGIETFGWISEDDVMIRSAGGAVWILIADEGQEGPPASTETSIDEASEANSEVSAASIQVE